MAPAAGGIASHSMHSNSLQAHCFYTLITYICFTIHGNLIHIIIAHYRKTLLLALSFYGLILAVVAFLSQMYSHPQSFYLPSGLALDAGHARFFVKITQTESLFLD